MRVGIAVESSLWGGLETHAVDVARVLARRGHAVIFVCSNRFTMDMFLENATARFDLALVPPFSSNVVRMVRALHRLSLDACLFEKGTLHAGSLSFDLAARLACGRYITVQHPAPPVLPAASARRFLGIRSPNLWRRRMVWRGYLRSLLPRTTVCVSDAVGAALHQDYRFAERDLTTVRNGVDVDRFREDPGARAEYRRLWGVSETAVLFGAVGRLVPEKGMDIGLEAFRRVAVTPANPSYLVIVGDGPERSALEALTRDLGLADRVRFAGFRADVPAVLSALDFLVLPSRTEGLPLVVLESLAVGRPVIASRVAGTPEIFTRDDVGWLVTPGDVGELADAMHEAAVLSPERVRTMRAAARQHAVGQFDASQQYAKIASLIEAH